MCIGADLPGVILQDCHYRSSPSLARAQLSAQFPAGKFCAACKDGTVSVEGKVCGWQSRGGDAGGGAVWARGPCALDAPSPAALQPQDFSAAQLQGMFCSADNCNSFLLSADPVKG